MVTITSMRTPEDGAAFSRLNQQWIEEFFTLEAQDRVSIDDPFGYITARGGDVLIAREGDEIVGCCALVPIGDDVYELSKMAVAPERRGEGFGRQIMEATLARARELGAQSLFLGSNSVLVSAVRLYESVGFEHVPRDSVGPLPYSRANVFMRLALTSSRSSARSR